MASASGVLVDDVEQLQPALVGGLVELEFQGPHLVGPLGTEQGHACIGPASLAARGWSLEALAGVAHPLRGFSSWWWMFVKSGEDPFRPLASTGS